MIAVSMSVRETDRASVYNYLVWSCCQLGVWNVAQPTLNPPLYLIGPFPRHEGRSALKALIMETTPVSICPYLSAFVVAVPGRGLSHTKPTECLSLWPPRGSTYLNLNSNYLAVTTFLKHAHAKTHSHTYHVLHMLFNKSTVGVSWVYSCVVCRL